MSQSQELTILDRATAAIVDMRPEFTKLSAGAVNIERFERAVLAALAANPKLLNAPPDSVLTACRKAAADRLVPDGKEGAIVLRWNSLARREEATWQPMVHGVIKIAKRYAGVKSVVCELVYEGEPFRVTLGDETRIEHSRVLDKVAPGKEVACYAVFHYGAASYEREREVMTRAQIEAIRERSPGFKLGKGPWVTDWGEMARKTLIHRLAKRLATSDDGDGLLRQVIGRIEEEYEIGRDDTPPPQAQAQPGDNVVPMPPRQPAQAQAPQAQAPQAQARDVDPETGEIVGSEPPPHPLYVRVTMQESGKPNWRVWGDGMKAALARCATQDDIRTLQAVNRDALLKLGQMNPEAYGRFIDTCVARSAEIGPPADEQPEPLDDGAPLGQG